MSIWDKIKDWAETLYDDTLKPEVDNMLTTAANTVVWLWNKVLNNVVEYNNNVEEWDKIIDTLQPEWYKKAYNWALDLWDKVWLWDYKNRVKETWQDFITTMDSKIPQWLLDHWVRSTDIAHYFTDPNSVPEKKRKYLSQFYDLNTIYDKNTIKKLNVISNQDISNFWLLSEKWNVAEKKYIQSEDSKYWYKLDDLIKQGIINKDKASELMLPIKEVNNSLYDIRKLVKSNPDVLKNKDYMGRDLQSYYDEYNNLRQTYVDKYIQKVKEYKWDREKLENDDSLSKLWNELTNIKWILKTEMASNSLLDTNPITNPVEFLDRLWTTVWTYAATWIWAAWRNVIEQWYNATVGKLTWTHLEQWMWFQQDINADWILDKAANLTTDITPYLPMWYVWVTSFWKWGSIISTIWKNVLWNTLINWTFNAAFDPAVSKNTAYFDTITWPITDWLFYWLWKIAWAWVNSLAKVKYWDLLDQATKVINNKELADSIKKSLTDSWDITKLNEIWKAKVNKAVNDYNKVLNDFIWKMKELNKRWSNIITSPLIRSAKKTVVKSFAETLRKQWQIKKANMLENLLYSWKSIDETFGALEKSIKTASNSLIKSANTITTNPTKLAALLDAEWTINDVIAKSITPKWIEPDKAVLWSEIEEQARITNKTWNTQNIPNATKYVTSKVEQVLSKFHKQKEVSFKEFRTSVMSAIEEDIGKLNPEAKAMYERVLDWFKGMDNTVKEIRVSKWLYWHSTNKWIYLNKPKWWISIWWAFDKSDNKVYIKYLENQFKDNPQGFFITLFHELTHSMWKWDFKKTLWDKEWQVVEKMYNKFVNALNNKNIINWMDDKTLAELKLLEDKDEFLAYIMWELIVWWDSKTLAKVTKVIREAWVTEPFKVTEKNINKFKDALNIYLDSRFWWKKILWWVKYMVDTEQAVKEWEHILDRDLKDLFKTKDSKTVWKIIHNMNNEEIKKLMKDLWIMHWHNTKELEDMMSNMTTKEIQDTLTYQIHMNLSWENWFKAASVWNAIWDIIDYTKKWTWFPNIKYLDNVVSKEEVKLLEWLPKAVLEWKTLEYIKQFNWKVSSSVSNVLLNLITTSPEINKDYINIVSALWWKLTNKLRQVSDKKSNLFNRFLNDIWTKYNINNIDRWTQELLTSIWYKLNNKNIAKEVEKTLKDWWDIQKYVQSWDIKPVDTWMSVEDMIRYNYARFNPDLANKLNKYVDTNNKLNNQLFKKYNVSDKELKDYWINKDTIRSNINQWLPEEYSRSQIYKEWNNIIYTDRSWNVWRVNSKWDKVLIDNSGQIVIKWLANDRNSRAFWLIDDISDWYDSFITLQNKLKECL